MTDREKKSRKLRTIEDLTDAHEYVFNQQLNGKIDDKAANALNTTLKGAVYLNGKLKLDAAKIYLRAQEKKIAIPNGMLPELTSEVMSRIERKTQVIAG
jgi:hypothetical protein